MKVYLVRPLYPSGLRPGADLCADWTAFDNKEDALEWVKEESADPMYKVQLKTIEVDFD